MLLLLLFVLLLFFCVFFLLSRDGNMIPIGTLDFRYYVVIIILKNLGINLSYKELGQLRLISLQ